MLDGGFGVYSQNGNLLGRFATKEAAEDFIEQYSALKTYSNEVGKVGASEAIRLLRERYKLIK